MAPASMVRGTEQVPTPASDPMAAAVCRLFDDVKLDIGPATDDGFYYDFAREEPFTDDDLETITGDKG